MLKPKAYTPGQRIVAAYQYPRLPYSLAVSATSHKSESVLTAICESAEITSVAVQPGLMRHRARFRVRSLNLQHVAVNLPKSADLWSVMLESEPVEVRQKQGAYIVPLPAGQAGSASEARELTLLYETDNPHLATSGFLERLWPRTISQDAPDIGIPTLGTTWSIYPPDGTDVVFSDGDFEPLTSLTRPTLVAWLGKSISTNSTSGLGWKFAGLVIAGIFVGFYAIIRTGRGCQVTLVELLVVVAIIFILIALLLPATQSAREAARRAACVNNMKQIGLALHNYHDTYGQFPPAVIGPPGVPRHRQFSWIVAILPFIEENNLYKQLRLDLPCDHPLNAAVLQVPLSAILCPSDSGQSETMDGMFKTSYVAITGADSTIGSGKTRGVMGFDKGLSVSEITDGTSNTVLLAEVTDGGPWFAGGYGTARRIDDWIGKDAWSEHPGVGNFVMADGSVKSVSVSLDPQLLRSIATAQGGEPVNQFHDDSPVEEALSYKTTSPAPESKAPADAAPAAKKEAKKAEKKSADEPRTPPAATGHEKTPAQEKPPTKAPPQPSRQAGERARLSLSVALEARSGEEIRFRREGGPGQLVLGLQDRSFTHSLQWLMVAAALLAAWIYRRAPASRRAIAIVMGLALPIGLSGLVPLVWTPLLDGLLLGSLAAVCLWILERIIVAVKTVVFESNEATLVICICLSLASGVCMAGERKAAPKAKTAASNPIRSSDLTLFIPYDPDKNKPLESTQVYLPHDEFLRLWKQAHPEKPAHAAPKMRAIVSYAEYSGRLHNDVARFDGRILIHHLSASWARIELPLGKVALEKIEIDGQPATLAGDSPPDSPKRTPSKANNSTSSQQKVSTPIDDRPAIYIDKPGLHVVDVRFSVPVSRLGATGQVTVPLRPLSSGRLLLRLPADDLDVQVSGCPGGWRQQVAIPDDKVPDKKGKTGKTVGDFISIPLGDVNSLSIRWQPRRVELREGNLTNVDQSLLVEVLDSGVHFHSKFRYLIQQGALNELRLRIPAGMSVQSVDGADVADWSIKTDTATGKKAPSQRLWVSLKKDMTNNTDVNIDCFRRNQRMPGNVDIQSLEPLGVVRETGRMAIDCSSHLRVRVHKAGGVNQINREELDLPQEPSEGCVLLSAYRYTSRPWSLQLRIERNRPRVEVSDRTVVAVTARQVTLRSLLSVDVADAPIPSLELQLPASLRVSQVRVPPDADWFIDRDDKGQQLKVKLSEPTVGNLDVALVGTLARDSSQSEFVVPSVIVDKVQAQRGQLAIYLDADLEAALTNNSGAHPIDPSALDSVLRPKDKGPAHYAFKYDLPPKDLRLRLSSAQSRLNADVTTVVSVREGAVAYISRVDFDIRQAGRSRLRVSTPKWLGDDIELQGDNIRQIRSELSNNTRNWEIELQQPVRGAYSLHLIQTLPLPDDGSVAAAIVCPIDVERSRSHIILENETADEIAVTKTTGTTPISIAAVPKVLTDTTRRHAVAAYRIADNAANLVWQRRVREQETGLTASINLADLTTVIHADGSYCSRASYNIRNFTLQFLELELPADSRIWSVHVSGQPVRPAKISRQGRTITLLPLEKTSAGDFSSKVVVIYSGHLGEALDNWTQVRPTAPRIISGVPVSRTLWTLHMPREYTVSLVKSESNLEEVAAAYQQEERKLSFLDELQQIALVAVTKGKSAAHEKARYNLKQAGSALHDYSEQSAQVDAANSADVQEQVQQIESQIKRLEELKTYSTRAEGETDFYFKKSQQKTQAGKAAVQLGSGFEKLPDSHAADAAQAAPKNAKKKDSGWAATRPEQQRGDLRKQAARQLSALQTMQQKEAVEQSKAVLQSPATLREGKPEADTRGLGDDDFQVSGRVIRDGQDETDVQLDEAATGPLSLDLDLALVGTTYHFRKLHGEPQLVLRARHENLSHWLTAIVWAVLCLALAAAVIHVLRRPNASTFAYRGWPWLAAAAGTAWLFLLPVGVFGLALLVVSLCVLITRSQKQ
ncbi:MAG: DUF1559 domain-containing protein [Pirellulales bacterium]|nr:DUF1559 domain-containing protein [Pirellulales bacterium]